MTAAVERLDRDVVDCLNTGYTVYGEGKLLVVDRHEGVWNCVCGPPRRAA
ncbi:hypothetical protein [Streptomyces sp. RFCAC02]|nr:hypothetical protein [Streptomyces sp. RFCAC02]